MIDKMLFWYQKLVKKEYLVDCDHLGIDSKEISIPQDYDLKTPLDIETFYNTVRTHSHCNYQSPNQYERSYAKKQLS